MACYLYIIGRDQGPVKIGISSNPSGRLEALRTGCPFRIALLHAVEMRNRMHAFEHEQCLHKVYADERLAGEWFDMDANSAREAVEMGISAEEYWAANPMKVSA